MFMLTVVREFCNAFIKGFWNGFMEYSYALAEEITGVSVCVITFNKLNVGNELFHSCMSIVTALISAYLIHRLKGIKYRIASLFKKKR